MYTYKKSKRCERVQIFIIVQTVLNASRFSLGKKKKDDDYIITVGESNVKQGI